MTDMLFYLTHTLTLAQLVASQTLSLCSPYVSRQHHDGFLHDGLDGGFNRGVCGVQLHCSRTWSAAPHPWHAHACQWYRIVTTWWKEHTPTCTTRMRSRAERCSRWIQVQFQRPRSFAQRIKKENRSSIFIIWSSTKKKSSAVKASTIWLFTIHPNQNRDAVDDVPMATEALFTSLH